MKKILAFIMSVMIGATMFTATIPQDTYALGTADCEKSFIGMRPWYQGLTEVVKDGNGNESCAIKKPKDGADSAGWQKFVWRIILNLSADLSMMVGYVAIVFIVYGGYLYIMSVGEPGKVASAKKTLANAIIGLVIALLATVIVNTIITVLGSAAS